MRESVPSCVFFGRLADECAQLIGEHLTERLGALLLLWLRLKDGSSARRDRVDGRCVRSHIAKGELKAVVLYVGHRQRFARHNHCRPGLRLLQSGLALRGRREIGDEHAIPDRHRPVLRLHVVDVEHGIVVRELIFEDARLNIRRQLRGRHSIADPVLRADRERIEPDRAHAGDKHRGATQNSALAQQRSV